MIPSIVFSLLLGWKLGSYAAQRSLSRADRTIIEYSRIGISMPVFWLVVLFLSFFVLRFDEAARFDILYHRFYPVFTLTVCWAAWFALLTRTNRIYGKGTPFFTSTPAYGVPTNSFPLIAGIIIVEKLYGLPGLGRLLFYSLLRRDTAIIFPLVFVFAILTVVMSLIIDTIYGILDRYSNHNPPEDKMSMDSHRPQSAPLNEPMGFWNNYIRNKTALLGLVLLLGLCLFAIIVPRIAPDPFQQNLMPPSSDHWFDTGYMPPSSDHWFGTDYLGRDILSRVSHGLRSTLIFGSIAGILLMLTGVLIGLGGKYIGPKDNYLTYITDGILMLPNLPLAIVILLIFNLGPLRMNLFFVIALLNWPLVARLVRVDTRNNRSISQIIPVYTFLSISIAIYMLALIEFLGLIGPIPVTIGWMIQIPKFVSRYSWWVSIFPGLLLFLTIWSIHLVGQGVSEAYIRQNYS
jgi:peptide/nickel transport system permease protein